jgi:hypothetical protein
MFLWIFVPFVLFTPSITTQASIHNGIGIMKQPLSQTFGELQTFRKEEDSKVIITSFPVHVVLLVCSVQVASTVQ